MFIICCVLMNWMVFGGYSYENSEGLSSQSIPSLGVSHPVPAQYNLKTQCKKAEPLRCLALRTRTGRLKKSLLFRGNSPNPPKWLVDMGIPIHKTYQ